MPSQTTSPPLSVTVLAALWVSLGRCAVSESPGSGCDNGKLSLDRDLPADAVYWNCPVSAWSESPQRLPSIDTVYDPEPARQICMDKSISYNRTIPNSGAYRPVRAEGGEYLYCPPQRWLNNLHHGATVLLYHPCAPLHERQVLSVLARTCLPDYIITPHPPLHKHTPIALVSWGRTLELSTVASSEVCDWLETTSTRKKCGSVSQGRKYNLLLTRSAEQHQQRHAHPEEQSAKMKEDLSLCCEQTISSLLNGAMETELESNMKKNSLKQINEEGKSRQIRATFREKRQDVKDEDESENTITHVSSFLSNQTKRSTLNRTGDAQNNSSTLGPSADSRPGNRTLSDPTGPRNAPSRSEILSINQSLTPRPTTSLGSDMSETSLRVEYLGFGASESQKSRLMPQTTSQQPALRNPNPSAGMDVLADGVNSEHDHTARTVAQSLSSKDEGTDSSRQRDKDSVVHSVKEMDSKEKHSDKDNVVKDNETVDVKERELEHKQTHSDTHSHRKSKKTGFDSVSKSQVESPPEPQQHQHPQPATYLPNSQNCEGCKEGEHCDCNKDSGAEVRAAVVNKGLPRTPRTDEAVWAAAALGFLLVLLTLSVLHTRLYRHWRTAPSLYWHDPQQDYDSVADVISRRLRIAKRRRKRGRRQECVLLPSSSSSDEHP